MLVTMQVEQGLRRNDDSFRIRSKTSPRQFCICALRRPSTRVMNWS